MPYNPFDKPVGEKLIADDLQKLLECNVAEGYYVEYKSDFPANEKIGKSIASFANTYGGWYVVGVKTDGHHIANEVCGFSLVAYPDPVSKVREIVKSYLDPLPVFYPQVVRLAMEDRAVLVVYIPGGQETPFVAKDGRIYRRTYDSSHPVPETSRHVIDRLVDNGRDVTKRFGDFCRDERTFSKSEEEYGWVKLFLSPYPLGMIEKHDILSSDGMEKLLQLSRIPIKILQAESFGEVTGNVQFNSAQPTYQSVILRQIAPANLAFNTLMVELFIDGRAKFFIPLRYFTDWREIFSLESQLVHEALRKACIAEKSSSIKYLRFFDIGQLWLAVAYLLSYYQSWIGEEPWLTDLRAALKIEGIWRSVPVFDSDEWGLHVQKYGLPVVLMNATSVPENMGRGLLIGLDVNRRLWPELCYTISLAFGLPLEIHSIALAQAVVRAAKRKPG